MRLHHTDMVSVVSDKERARGLSPTLLLIHVLADGEVLAGEDAEVDWDAVDDADAGVDTPVDADTFVRFEDITSVKWDGFPAEQSVSDHILQRIEHTLRLYFVADKDGRRPFTITGREPPQIVRPYAVVVYVRGVSALPMQSQIWGGNRFALGESAAGVQDLFGAKGTATTASLAIKILARTEYEPYRRMQQADLDLLNAGQLPDNYPALRKVEADYAEYGLTVKVGGDTLEAHMTIDGVRYGVAIEDHWTAGTRDRWCAPAVRRSADMTIAKYSKATVQA